MLRVSIHSSLPSQASRFNRTDWLDIGYQKLESTAEYKIVLFEAGIGARQPAVLQAYPRWSSSLWDLAARAIALAYWSAPTPADVHVGVAPSAIGADGDAVPVDNFPAPGPRKVRPKVFASQIHMPPAEDVGSRCAFAKHTTAFITHFPSTGAGGRRLGQLFIAHDKKVRGLYGASWEEDARDRRLVSTFFFSPKYLRPAELVCRTACFMLSGSVDALPACPALQVPKGEVIDGVEYVAIHRLDEPARSGIQRWLMKQDLMPKPARGASLGRIPAKLYEEFLESAI